VALTPATWLIDKSVLARLDLDAIAEVVLPRIQAGEVGVALVTELDVAFSARSTRDYRSTREDLVDHLIPLTMPVRAGMPTTGCESSPWRASWTSPGTRPWGPVTPGWPRAASHAGPTWSFRSAARA
jgi:hypothetical protein